VKTHVLAHALEHAGRVEEALAVWRELAEEEPGNGVVLMNIRRIEALLQGG